MRVTSAMDAVLVELSKEHGTTKSEVARELLAERLSWVLLALAHIATSAGLHRAQRRNQPPPTAWDRTLRERRPPAWRRTRTLTRSWPTAPNAAS